MAQSTVECTRCQPGQPCLSHTRLPFGSVYCDPQDPLVKAHPNRIERIAANHQANLPSNIKRVAGRKVRNSIGFVKINLKGLCFDEVPLRYLDWLAGQPWLYGNFEKRLYKYLLHPCIQKELDELFPDPDDDSREPAFIPSIANERSKWHYPMRKEDNQEQSDPVKWVYTKTQAWQRAADYLQLFETITDPEDWKEQVHAGELRAISQLISPVAANKLREAYRQAHEWVMQQIPVSDEYYWVEEAVSQICDRLSTDQHFARRLKRFTRKLNRSIKAKNYRKIVQEKLDAFRTSIIRRKPC